MNIFDFIYKLFYKDNIIKFYNFIYIFILIFITKKYI